jgi:SAM-dependent methyltransferase
MLSDAASIADRIYNKTVRLCTVASAYTSVVEAAWPMTARVNYDEIAGTFDARYAAGLYDGVLAALVDLISAKRPTSALEVGCGTGHWLSALRGNVEYLWGVDCSLEMLRRAAAKCSGAGLLRATAHALPLRHASADLVFCVNAIHHFERFEEFIAEAKRLLRPSGMLVVIGMDPHHGRDQWCVYDYFPETRAADLDRYPSSRQITDAMLRAGFSSVECRVASRFRQTRWGRAVLADPELQRNGCSQLALLSDAQYDAGIGRIESALRRAEGKAEVAFKVDIAMMLECGTVEA